jgi:hypothetical protein
MPGEQIRFAVTPRETSCAAYAANVFGGGVVELGELEKGTSKCHSCEGTPSLLKRLHARRHSNRCRIHSRTERAARYTKTHDVVACKVGSVVKNDKLGGSAVIRTCEDAYLALACSDVHIASMSDHGRSTKT